LYRPVEQSELEGIFTLLDKLPAHVPFKTSIFYMGKHAKFIYELENAVKGGPHGDDFVTIEGTPVGKAIINHLTLPTFSVDEKDLLW